MNLVTVEEFLIRNVFSKMRYDSILEKYIVPKEAYLTLDLTDKEFLLLEDMCKRNDILLEKLPDKISTEDIEKLFIKYKYLKNVISFNNIKDENSLLFKKRIELRNKIATYYMKEVVRLILRRFPDIDNRNDREDIYQIGYEKLLFFVDIYDPDKNDNFSKFLNNYILSHIIREIGVSRDSLSAIDNHKLSMIKKKSEVYENENGMEASVDDLVNITNYKKSDIEELLILSRRMEFDSVDKIIEDEMDDDSLDLLDDSFEDKMIDIANKNVLLSIIDTLPIEQAQVLLLYFGFVGGKTHTFNEISKIFNISSQNARILMGRAMDALKEKVRLDAIKELYSIEDNSIKEKVHLKNNTYLKTYLIGNLDRDNLNMLINKIPKKYREVLMLYFGIKDGRKHNILEISELMKCSIRSVKYKLNVSLGKLNKVIDEYYVLKYSGKFREGKTPVENMMFEYINKPLNKEKRRKK